jgi:hypothetical protein
LARPSCELSTAKDTVLSQHFDIGSRIPFGYLAACKQRARRIMVAEMSSSLCICRLSIADGPFLLMTIIAFGRAHEPSSHPAEKSATGASVCFGKSWTVSVWIDGNHSIRVKARE